MGFIFLVVIIVDPFGIYNFPLIAGFNQEKIEPDKHFRLVKAFEIRHQKPKSIIFGSSRTKGGIDVKDANKQTGQVFLNCSFNGASFDEIYEYFLYALYIQPELQTVIIGIDLFAFNKVRCFQDDFSNERLQKCIFNFHIYNESCFSLGALISTWKTIKFNLLKTSFFQSINSGFLVLQNENPGVLDMGEMGFLKFMLETEYSYKDYEISQNKLEKFRHLVEICKNNEIDLKVFVCPVKAMYWEFYYQNGLWDKVEELKWNLCSIYPLWDFSGYTPLTTETMHCNSPMYFECSHFTPFAGQILLKQMFEGPEISNTGCLLTPEIIDTYLAKILEDRQKWLQGSGKEIHVNLNDSFR